MIKRRYTDDDVAAILACRAPLDDEHNAPLGAIVVGLRDAFDAGSAPAPSAQLAARLDLDYLQERSGIAIERGPIVRTGTSLAYQQAPVRTPVSRIRRWIGWLSGLTLAIQVSLGSTVAFAAVIGAGAIGALPGPAQELFDRIVTSVAPSRDDDRAEDSPVPLEIPQPSDVNINDVLVPARQSTPDDEKDKRETKKRAQRQLTPTMAPTPTPDVHENIADVEQPTPPQPAKSHQADSTDTDDDVQDAADDARDDARDNAEEAADEDVDASNDAAADSVDAQDEAQEDSEEISSEPVGSE